MDRLVIEVPAELFAPAESSSFEGSFDMGSFNCGPDAYTCPRPLDYRVLVSNVGGALLVGGTIEGEVVTSCGRCLEDVVIPIEGEVEGYFIIEGEGEAPDDMDEDEFDVLPESHIIDLESLLRAAVLVDLPLVPLCDEACLGICPECGKNLNEGPCSCSASAEDEVPLGKNNPFAALKGMTFE